MIYLITGVPGSGKTLYAVSTLVQTLAKQKVKRSDGTEIERRLLVEGVPNLLLPHELLSAPPDADTVALARVKGHDQPGPEGDGLWNWYDWCKPGDLILIDEVQRYWRPRGMGTKPPREIQLLETHRHYGVDFVVITQNPMLIDQNVRRLVGTHKHVRRLFGMQRAVIYEWDGCQADVSRVSTAVSKSYFSYPKSAYALYKSSELHTKPKQSIPAWTLVPVLALVGGVMVAPTAFRVMHGAATGKGVSLSSRPASPASSPVAPTFTPSPVAAASSPVSPASGIPPLPGMPAGPAYASLAAPLPPPPVLAGCAATASRCTCYDTSGHTMRTTDTFCRAELPQRVAIRSASTGVPLQLANVPLLAGVPGFLPQQRVIDPIDRSEEIRTQRIDLQRRHPDMHVAGISVDDRLAYNLGATRRIETGPSGD